MEHDKFISTGDGACSIAANLMIGRQPDENGERTRVPAITQFGIFADYYFK